MAEPVPDSTRSIAIPAELPTPVRAAMARIDLVTRALPREQQQDVFEFAEEIYWAGRSQAAADIRTEMTSTPIVKPMSPELAAELVEYCAQLAEDVAAGEQPKERRRA